MKQTITPRFGDWQNLCSQQGRYKAIVNRVDRANSILDVGCGEGHLAKFLHSKTLYTGIDISPFAVKAANSSNVLLADARNYVPSHSYDVIVLNEMLYYLDDPIAVIRHYKQYLNKGGTMIISIYLKEEPFSFRHVMRRIMQPQKPVSNLHCLAIVRQFLRSEDILSTRQVVTDGACRWEILTIC